jgi:hypothetical protein
MVWQQPQLTDPLMGPTDEIKKLQHRLLFAYSLHSRSHDHGVIESGLFDVATDQSLRDIQAYLDGTFVAVLGRNFVNSQPGVLTYDTKLALGVIVLPPKAPTKKFVQQGVGTDTSAFLMGTTTHSYVDAINEQVAELNRMMLPLVGVPKIPIGYSMGADGVNHWLLQWPANRRDEIKCVVKFGDPSRSPGPTLLGDNPPGQGIAGLFTPDWVADRTFSFCMPGDMYPEAVGLLPWFYQLLTRMALTLDFAVYLFNFLISQTGSILLGLTASGMTGAGALSAIAPLVTSGPSHTVGTDVLQPLTLLGLLPQIIPTLGALLSFVQTNAHYHYHDQPQPQWRGLTGVDCAAQIIQETVPGGGIAITVPGTVATWNDGPPAWTAWKLP